MAAAVAFDTLKLARKLEAAGFEQKQAADTAEALAEAMATAELATKADIRETELRLEAKITAVEGRLEARIIAVEGKICESEFRLEAKLGEVKADILKWVVGLLLAQAAVIATLVKLL